MGVLKAVNLAKAFGTKQIFSGVNLEIRRGDRIGLIGPNGAGKTTLLRCLLGLEPVDAGQVILPEGETVGYVEQDAAASGCKLYEELRSAYADVLLCQQEMQQLERAMALETDQERSAGLMKRYAALVERFEQGGGYEYEAMIRRVASGLGFSGDDLNRPVLEFSGGQKTRIGLAKALLRRPEFLFLDEPTNHLDIEMVEWLEDFLAGYPGGMLIISHDRYFLDRVASRILELENHELVAYRGNYTAYLAQKAERLEALRKAYEQQQEYIARTEAFIRRYKAGVKAKQARGRQSQLNRLERIEGPREGARLDFNLTHSGGSAERVAELENVTAGYGERVVFEGLSLLIRRGEGVALVGPNGAGKSTVLKLLTGDLQPAGGRIKIGSRVKIGYFAQEHEDLNAAFRVIDEITAEYGFSEDRARKYLGAFLFCGDDVYKCVGDLSGGEKARLALLKLMLKGANFLILDEPTNHLDIEAKEAVEEAILDYPGTYLVVSHDRYFLDKIAGRVVELAEGRIREYAGNYSYYREKKAADLKAKEQAPQKPAPAKNKPEGPLRPRRRKPDAAKQALRLEQEIAEMEIMKKVLEQRLNDPASHADPEASRALAEEYADLQAGLEEKYSEWLELTDEPES